MEFRLGISILASVACFLGAKSSEAFAYQGIGSEKHVMSFAQKTDPLVRQSLSGLAAAKAMGRGFNLGNTFDAYGKGSNWRRHDAAFTKSLIDQYVSRGFTNVRIPITWLENHENGTLALPGGGLNRSLGRFKDLKATIDYALSKGLWVIINAHHELWLKKGYDGSEAMRNRFYGLWSDIAWEFKDYSSKLVFHILNEPEGRLGDFNGGASPYDGKSQQWTRDLNLAAYEAIRATGGMNAQRLVMVSPNAQGNHAMLRYVYPLISSLPGGGQDPFVMVAVHSYDPWRFCGPEGNNGYYRSNLAKLTADIRNGFQNVLAWKGYGRVGIYYGEYGVGRYQQASRAEPVVKEYYRLMTQGIIDLGLGGAVWDDGGWFRVVDDSRIGKGDAFVFGLDRAILNR
ncbi:glycoside hydrolase family 5 protein [Pseudobacteriovorax antillogorgiicola]|uniref:Aryl-phospho-beta-D-glucosidase BglC, GH1 family n=1 Tax=Pseudobacteriovorax antillogorgiicola TaxID=1513793 RepID=A0A1Y6B9K8_9BACT|nr:cellulase family glycosylhydrolase [Pseudobacteriovorax antillogorgiicola]TCS57509.1 aryl-phospho-beta-D-glucosidase BglC (GH1 family) [Pseudobacteriovorax antillogorgiicola]SMF00221.1 Aryl-phospho-beta-D-glucosidase BglC, GH1 family [Pseudobacteriovorax antillogorgiicola]